MVSSEIELPRGRRDVTWKEMGGEGLATIGVGVGMGGMRVGDGEGERAGELGRT